MDTKSLMSLVDQLEENIDDLEESLQPLIEGALATTAKKLPVLDRAKLNVLVVYSIESLLFSYLKLHGVQAKDHAVFRELTRVKQYFEKIKEAETGPQVPPALTLNKEAASRIIKHALAGNDKYDLERAEREARERVLANMKLKNLEASMKMKAQAQQDTDGADTNAALQQAAQLASLQEPVSSGSSSPSSSESESEDEGAVLTPKPTPPSKYPVAVRPDKPHLKSDRLKIKAEPAQIKPPQGKKRKAKPTEEDQEAKKQKKQEKKAKKAQKKAEKKAAKKLKNEAAAG